MVFPYLGTEGTPPPESVVRIYQPPPFDVRPGQGDCLCDCCRICTLAALVPVPFALGRGLPQDHIHGRGRRQIYSTGRSAVDNASRSILL